MSNYFRTPVQSIDTEALNRYRQELELRRHSAEQYHREGSDQGRGQPLSPSPDIPTISYMELAPASPGDRLYLEWNYYLREVEQLLSAGHDGRFVLIKGEEIVGIYDSFEAADAAGLECFPLDSYLVKQIRAREPMKRIHGMSIPWPY